MNVDGINRYFMFAFRLIFILAISGVKKAFDTTEFKTFVSISFISYPLDSNRHKHNGWVSLQRSSINNSAAFPTWISYLIID